MIRIPLALLHIGITPLQFQFIDCLQLLRKLALFFNLWHGVSYLCWLILKKISVSVVVMWIPSFPFLLPKSLWFFQGLSVIASPSSPDPWISWIILVWMMLPEQRHGPSILKATWNFNKPFFSPLPSVSECSLLYPTLWNSKPLSDKHTLTPLLPCAPICSYQVMLLSNNVFFFPRTFPFDELTRRDKQKSLVHLFTPQLVGHKSSARKALGWGGIAWGAESTRSSWHSRTLQLSWIMCSAKAHPLAMGTTAFS